MKAIAVIFSILLILFSGIVTSGASELLPQPIIVSLKKPNEKKADSKNKNVKVQIVSWNLKQLSAFNVEKGMAGIRTLTEINLLQTYAKKINADIYILQEISGINALQPIFGDAYHYYITPDGGSMKLAIAIKKDMQAEQISDPRHIATINVTNTIRGGLELNLRLGTEPIDILGVHLKSFCHDAPLSRNTKDCRILKSQIAPLKQWMRSRIEAMHPFIIVGDFNRRFDKETLNRSATSSLNSEAMIDNWMWASLFDENASGYQAGLVRPNRFNKSKCLNGKYPYFIDHFIMNEPAANLVEIGSFQEYFTDLPLDIESKLSDHCPVSLVLINQQTKQ